MYFPFADFALQSCNLCIFVHTIEQQTDLRGMGTEHSLNLLLVGILVCHDTALLIRSDQFPS